MHKSQVNRVLLIVPLSKIVENQQYVENAWSVEQYSTNVK